MVQILKLSGSILGRAVYKSKRRKPKITLADLTRVISDPTSARMALDDALYVHLLETVCAFEDIRWLPVIGTEYERTHFVTRDEQYRDVFRATLDTRVTHYAFDENSGGYVGVPVGTEDISRFEVKLDETRLAGTALGDWLDTMVVAFRAFRIPSKKYRGMTLRSAYELRRAGLRNELPGFRVYAEFASRPVRYRHHEHYVNLARYIQSSKPFHLYHDPEDPHLLEDHEHYVEGTYKGLSVTISGSQLEYWRDRELIATKPVAIFREDARPVTSVPPTSRYDLDHGVGVAKMKGRRRTTSAHEDSWSRTDDRDACTRSRSSAGSVVPLRRVFRGRGVRGPCTRSPAFRPGTHHQGPHAAVSFLASRPVTEAR